MVWYNLASTYTRSGNRSAALDAVKELRRYDPQEADQLLVHLLGIPKVILKNQNLKEIKMEDSSKLKAILTRINKIEEPPSLYTLNGCGQSIYGKYYLENKLLLKATFITLIFLPLFPTGIYLVEELDYGSYRFYGKIRIKDLFSILGVKEIVLFIVSIILSSIGMILVLFLSLFIAAYIIYFFKKIF